MSKSYEELLKSLEAIDNEQAEDEGAEDEGAEGEDDETIAAAAAEGEAGDKPVTKSMSAVGVDGETVEVIDATELVKSLQDTQTQQGEVLTKALETFTSVIAKQGALIKSLQADVKSLAGQGRGRKTVLTVLEKPAVGALTKSHGAADDEKAGLTKEAFFAKANAAFDAGKLSGQELTTVDVALRSGQLPSEGIINKVLG